MIIRGMQTGPLQANTYIIIDEKTKESAIIDPGGYTPAIEDVLKMEDALDPEYIILTHGHSDHIGGIPKLRELYPEIKVLCAEAEIRMLKHADKEFKEMPEGRDTMYAPDITVNEGDTLKIGEEELVFHMTPGHTKGGMVIYNQGVIFTGDTLFRESIGRTDFPGGSYPEIITSIKEKIFQYPDNTVVLPGHMAQSTIGHEKQNNPFLQGKA